MASVFDKFAATAKAGADSPFLHIPCEGATGDWLRLIGGGLAATPFALFSVK